MTQDERQERVKAARQRWERGGHKASPLPPPEELARVQTQLIAAAARGKAEFNRVWQEIFRGKFPSPGTEKFLPNVGDLRKKPG